MSSIMKVKTAIVFLTGVEEVLIIEDSSIKKQGTIPINNIKNITP